jgi:hypothetical protein
MLGLVVAGCKPARKVSLAPGVIAAPQPAKVDSDPSLIPDPALSGTFAFAEDSGGKILAKILPPPDPARASPEPKTTPKPRKGLSALEQPDANLPSVNHDIPGPAQPKRPPLRPRLLSDAAPLDHYQADPIVPARPELPSTTLVRQPGRDVNEPIPLPAQAKQLPDRASVEDPTAEFSGQRVVNHQPAMRSTPVPFVRMNLPEPFEHRVVVRVAEEEPPIVAPVPRPPK